MKSSGASCAAAPLPRCTHPLVNVVAGCDAPLDTPAGLLGVLEDRAQSNSSTSLAIGTAHAIAALPSYLRLNPHGRSTSIQSLQILKDNQLRHAKMSRRHRRRYSPHASSASAPSKWMAPPIRPLPLLIFMFANCRLLLNSHARFPQCSRSPSL